MRGAVGCDARECGNLSGTFTIIKTAADIEAAKAQGKIGLIGQLESARRSERVRVLRVFHRLGVRVAGLRMECDPDSLTERAAP